MKISIGENLKVLRNKKGLTQEQLAEVLGVSAQAISRWENNTSYPDITLLPGLAIFYNTSVDAIIGMDTLRKEEALREIHGKINEYVGSGQPDVAITLIRDCLKMYPNDSGLLMSLSETLAHIDDDPDATKEAISLAERILEKDDVSLKAKSTTSANLLFLYLRAEKQEKAATLIQSLPHFWESREFLMPEVYTDAQHAEELKICITKILTFLHQKVCDAPKRQLGVTPKYVQLGPYLDQTYSIEQIVEEIMQFIHS